ncbi:hypothetical protein N2152v2_008760 [Parachlorella kessleri]
MLQGGWWFGPRQAAAGEEQSAPAMPQAAGQQQGRASSAWWWPFGENNNKNTNGTPGQLASSAQQHTQNSVSKQRLARPRSTPANLDAAARAQPKVRPPRVASSAKLQASAVTEQRAAGSTAATRSVPPVEASSSTVAAAPKRPLSSRQLRPEGQPKAAGVRASALNKQLSYQERRRHWRERLEQAKAKAERRAAASATAASEGAPGPPSGLTGTARKFTSRHIAIPASKLGNAAGSSHSTPAGSPIRRTTLGGEAGYEGQHHTAQQAGGRQGTSHGSPPAEFLDVPPIWQGFQTAEAPSDFSTCSEDQLRRFLQQAGRTLSALDLLASAGDTGQLVGAAREARNAWEVERIMVACQWPQEVLRVPRHSDAATLKTAYRRVSMAVHPDKNTVAGASDAMSIVADAYNMLTLAGGKSAATIPAFMRQNHPTRHSNLHPGSQAAPATAGADPRGPATSEPTPQQQEEQQQQQQRQGQSPEAAGLTKGPDAAEAGGAAGYAASSHAENSQEGSISHVSSFEYLAEEHYFAQHQRNSSVEQLGQHSFEAEQGGAPELPSRHLASEGTEHWNPHGHLSSTDELSPKPGVPGSSNNSSSQAAGTAGQPNLWTSAGIPISTGLGNRSESIPVPAARSSSSRGSLGRSPTVTFSLSGSPAGSRPETPYRPASATSSYTPSHSRSSSGHSFASFEATQGGGPSPSAKRAEVRSSQAGSQSPASPGLAGGRFRPSSPATAAAAGHQMAGGARATGASKPTQKIVVRVKYKTAAAAAPRK